MIIWIDGRIQSIAGVRSRRAGDKDERHGAGEIPLNLRRSARRGFFHHDRRGEAAWTKVYGVLADTMQAGAAEAAVVRAAE